MTCELLIMQQFAARHFFVKQNTYFQNTRIQEEESVNYKSIKNNDQQKQIQIFAYIYIYIYMKKTVNAIQL